MKEKESNLIQSELAQCKWTEITTHGCWIWGNVGLLLEPTDHHCSSRAKRKPTTGNFFFQILNKTVFAVRVDFIQSVSPFIDLGFWGGDWARCEWPFFFLYFFLSLSPWNRFEIELVCKRRVPSEQDHQSANFRPDLDWIPLFTRLGHRGEREKCQSRCEIDRFHDTKHRWRVQIVGIL